MYVNGQLRAEPVSKALATTASRRSLRTARFLLVVIAFLATAAAIVALVAVHRAPPEVILLLFVAAIWLGSLWYVERRTLDRELQLARVRLLDAGDTERLRIQRDLHDSAQQRLISVRIRLGLLADSTASP